MRTLLLTYLLLAMSHVRAQDTFQMKSGDSTVTMQKYFMCFLKQGPDRNQDSVAAADIQNAHLAHIDRLWREGHASIAGPFDGDGDLRGIVIFNTATREEAEKLAAADPAVMAGRLMVEVVGWWAMKGASLK